MEQPNFFNSPIFITGFNKSGTTLLLSLLDWHSRLMVFPEELHFCRKVLLVDDFRKALRADTGIRMFMSDDYMSEWTQGKSWSQDGYPDFDKEHFSRVLEDIDRYGATNRWSYLAAVLYGYAEVAGMQTRQLTHWVSKTTQNEVYFPLVQRVFNRQARWIYVVRDPRDVFTSLLKRAEHAGYMSAKSDRYRLRAFAALWQQQVNSALQFRNSNDNFTIVRYEDLLADCEKVMRACCEFMGVPFEGACMEPSRGGRPWGGNSVHVQSYNGLSTNSIGRYREILAPEVTRDIEALLGPEMRELGYCTRDNALNKPSLLRGLGPLRLRARFRYSAKLGYLWLRTMAMPRAPFEPVDLDVRA